MDTAAELVDRFNEFSLALLRGLQTVYPAETRPRAYAWLEEKVKDVEKARGSKLVATVPIAEFLRRLRFEEARDDVGKVLKDDQGETIWVPIRRRVRVLDAAGKPKMDGGIPVYEEVEPDVAKEILGLLIPIDVLNDLDLLPENEQGLQYAQTFMEYFRKVPKIEYEDVQSLLRFADGIVRCPKIRLSERDYLNWVPDTRMWFVRVLAMMTSLAVSWEEVGGDATLAAQMGKLAIGIRDALKPQHDKQ